MRVLSRQMPFFAPPCANPTNTPPYCCVVLCKINNTLLKYTPVKMHKKQLKTLCKLPIKKVLTFRSHGCIIKSENQSQTALKEGRRRALTLIKKGIRERLATTKNCKGITAKGKNNKEGFKVCL